MKKGVLMILFFICHSSIVQGIERPCLFLTKKNIETIRKEYAHYPLFSKAFQEMKNDADKAINSPFAMPSPKGKGGSYSHTTHLLNASNLRKCGIVYQITQDGSYAEFVKKGLLEYADKYKTYGKHPDYSPGFAGTLFFQQLNESVWTVDVVQAYDCVYEYLSPNERSKIETQLFVPLVEWATVENKKNFDKIHNHATWSVAAVGMLGYVTKNEDWSDMALYGTEKDGSGGFLKQLDELFSPDGYYNEGPYYHRYALMPFCMLAEIINKFQPELRIFDRRDRLLIKAVDAIIQLSTVSGYLFPLNDADKSASIKDSGIVQALNIIYSVTKEASELLDIAIKQETVTVSDAGFEVAKNVFFNKAKPFMYKTMWLKDGMDGSEGGVGIIRKACDDNNLHTVVLKATSQGQGHGHYDRLNMLYYDNGEEIFGDYGFARYVDVESKRGGEYLPENNVFAKQTIAHNTIVVDNQSHFDANYSKAMSFFSERIFFVDRDSFSVVSAIESNAYNGVNLIRTVGLLRVKEMEQPLLLDVVKSISSNFHHYDIPYWYNNGQLIAIPFKLESYTNNLTNMGNNNGYQFLWKNGYIEVKTVSENNFLSFVKNNRYYTTTFTCNAENIGISFVTIGANDPEFSLRNEKGFIFSAKTSNNYSFCSITTSANEYSGSPIRSLRVFDCERFRDVVTFAIGNSIYEIILEYEGKNIDIHTARMSAID